LPELKGKHVHPFHYEWDQKHYISYGSWLAAPREAKYFKGERIIFREILSNRLVCTLIIEDFKIDRSLYIALPKPKAQMNNYYVLGLLSSKLLAFYFRYTSNEFDKVFPKIRVAEFKALPIKLSNGNDQKRIVDIVHQILVLKKSNSASAADDLESQLDEAVYRLYNLTPDEIIFVEHSSK
jgi:restriction endonuclease S subunit